MEVLLRWLPSAAAAGYLTMLLGRPAYGWEFVHQRAAAVTITVLWLAAALVIALTRIHRVAADNLRLASPRPVILTVAAILLLAALSAAGYASASWIPLLLLLLNVSLASKKPTLSFLALLMVLLIPALLIEGVLVWARSSVTARQIPGLSGLATTLYRQDWSVLQYHQDCAQFDPELLYTLRPGVCTFENTEYTTEYAINNLGVRDDDASLEAPQVIVAGDSHAVGWGVQQHETFAEKLQEITALRVLNTGIPSYGTARELSLLLRTDRSRLRYLVLQYCPNDDPENRSFCQRGPKPPRTKDQFEQNVQIFERTRQYYPGKYITYTFSAALRRGETALCTRSAASVSGTEPGIDSRTQAMMDLLQVIETHPIDLAGVKIVLTRINEAEDESDDLKILAKQLASRRNRRHMALIEVVDLTEGLSSDDYWPIDGHMKASGHQKVAEKLAEILFRDTSPADFSKPPTL